MLKSAIISFGALCLLATAAPAQEVRIGPGGVTIGRDRDEAWERRQWRREHRWDRDRTGTIVERRHRDRCRTVVIRRETDDGDIVTRRVRRCG
jgi:hypothetical protein